MTYWLADYTKYTIDEYESCLVGIEMIFTRRPQKWPRARYPQRAIEEILHAIRDLRWPPVCFFLSADKFDAVHKQHGKKYGYTFEHVHLGQFFVEEIMPAYLAQLKNHRKRPKYEAALNRLCDMEILRNQYANLANVKLAA